MSRLGESVVRLAWFIVGHYQRFSYQAKIRAILHSYQQPLGRRILQTWDLYLYYSVLIVRLLALAASVKYNQTDYLTIDSTMRALISRSQYDPELVVSITCLFAFLVMYYHKVKFQLGEPVHDMFQQLVIESYRQFLVDNHRLVLQLTKNQTLRKLVHFLSTLWHGYNRNTGKTMLIFRHPIPMFPCLPTRIRSRLIMMVMICNTLQVAYNLMLGIEIDH